MANIKVMALGGLDERGKNLYLIEVDENIFVFDVGLKLPLREMLGIDVIIPDFSYLMENKNRIRAIFISKPSDDSFGALPYLLKSLINAKDLARDADNKLKLTVYGSTLTHFMIDQKMKNFRLSNWENSVNYRVIDVNVNLRIANTNAFIYPFRTTTSLPGSLGYALNIIDQANMNDLRQPLKFDETIIYTGDYIFDGSETDDFNMSIRELTNIRNLNRSGKILLLISESSYANRKDFTAPNHKIVSLIETSMEEAPGRVIFACYDQDLFRISEIFQAIQATCCDRPVAIHGQTLNEILRAISDHGNDKTDLKTELVNKINIKGFNVTFDQRSKQKNKTKVIPINSVAQSNNAVIIVTGSGERLFAKMNKITTGNDELLKLQLGDTVILATPPIPGNELAHAAVLDELARTDARVISISDKQTWNVNASYEDVKLLTKMVEPKYFLPVKGLYKDLYAARNAAIDAGVLHNNALILDNGQTVVFKDGNLVEYSIPTVKARIGVKNKKTSSPIITTGDVYVDGIGVGDIGAIVIEERRRLMSDGVLITGLTINKKTKEITSLIDAQMRGVVYLTNNEAMLKNIQTIITNVVEKSQKNPAFSTNDIKNKIKLQLQDYIEKETGKRPMILPVINEI